MKKGLIFLLTLTTFLLASEGKGAKVGGYGELHLNYSKAVDSDATPAPKLDFHRFVLFAGYDWNEKWGFNSELELEHNFVQDGEGELELEQAYVEFRANPAFNLQGGVILPSVGLINENHEPALFLTTERPDYSKNIIPTTWFGNGIAATGVIKGAVDYKVVLMEGLDDSKFSEKSGIRSGRQKGYKPVLSNILVNGRVNYIAVPGLVAGASVSVNELVNETVGDHLYNRTTLVELHAKYKANNLFATAEFGNISYTAIGSAPLEQSQGFYADFGYNVASFWGAEKLELFPFVRYGIYDPSGAIDGESAYELSQIQWGLTLLPIKQVAVKVDFGIDTKVASEEQTFQFNAGIGYDF